MSWGNLFFILLILVVIPISNAENEPKSKISFTDEVEGFVFQEDQLKFGVNISIKSDLNVSKNVSIKLSDLSTDTGYHIFSSDIISKLPVSKNISEENVEIFNLKFKEGIIAHHGTYTGKIIVTSSNSESIYKDFTLIIPSYNEKFTLISEEITIFGTSHPFLPSLTRFSSKNLYVYKKNTASNKPPNLSAIVTNGDGKEGKVIPQIEKAEFYDEYIAMPLKVDGIYSAGKYSGTLYLDPGDSNREKEKIKIIVLINDFILWPFFVILIGVMISYKVTQWWKDGRLRHGLKDKILVLAKEVVNQQNDFAKEHDKMPYSHYKISCSFELWKDDMLKEIDEIIDFNELNTIKSNIDVKQKNIRLFKPFLINTELLFNKYLFFNKCLAEENEYADPIFFLDVQNLLIGQPIFENKIENINNNIIYYDEFLDIFNKNYNKLCDLNIFLESVMMMLKELNLKNNRTLGEINTNINVNNKKNELLKIKSELWKTTSKENLEKTEKQINEFATQIFGFKQTIFSDCFLKIFFELVEIENKFNNIRDKNNFQDISTDILLIKNKIENSYQNDGINFEELSSKIEELDAQITEIKKQQNLNERYKINLFWNHERISMNLTPETHTWLKKYIPKEVTNIKDIQDYLKKINPKIEFDPEIINSYTDVKIQSDLGYIPNIEGRQFVKFKWIYIKNGGDAKEFEYEVDLWDRTVPKININFKQKGDYLIELKLGDQLLDNKTIHVRGTSNWLFVNIKFILKFSLNNSFNFIYNIFNGLSTVLATSIVLIATLLIVSICGLSLLYTNEGFGSLRDYLLAFIWGSTGDQAIRIITSLIGKVSK